MAYKGINAKSPDERTVEFLKRDFSILIKGTEGKSLDEINLNSVFEFIGLLEEEVRNVKAGIRARDNFISYTLDSSEIPFMFELTGEDMAEGLEKIRHDGRALEFLQKDFLLLLKGIDGKELSEIDFDGVLEYLARLKEEVKEMKEGFRAKDMFMSYAFNTNQENAEDIFAKKPTKKQ